MYAPSAILSLQSVKRVASRPPQEPGVEGNEAISKDAKHLFTRLGFISESRKPCQYM